MIEELRALLLARRQALLIELGAIEECLGMERSVIPKHKATTPVANRDIILATHMERLGIVKIG